MRAAGRDITELFGYAPDDVSAATVEITRKQFCPFTRVGCSKTNHDQSEVYGTCSVSHGSKKAAGSEIIVCPNRLYAKNYAVFHDVVKQIWASDKRELIVGGNLADLAARAGKHAKTVVGFGQNSGKEIQVDAFGKLSMDWVLQAYDRRANQSLEPIDFVGLEVQSLDITGNYRENWASYIQQRLGKHNSASLTPDSGHGLNWANVHKRIIPQLIRKGNIYAAAKRCRGFFFIVPEAVYQKFEQILGSLPHAAGAGRSNLSILTYSLGPEVPKGAMRQLVLQRKLHYALSDIKEAFINRIDEVAPKTLDAQMLNVL